MPLPAPLTNQHRLLRTLLMWLLLALTIAGAALLSHFRIARAQTVLREPATYGAIDVRLPKGWQVTTRENNGSTRVVAREPGGRSTLTIIASPSEAQFDPTEFLLRAQAIAIAMGEHELAQYDEPVTVPGGNGTIYHITDTQENPITSMAHLTFDSGQTVTVDLQNTGLRTPEDEELLLDVTQSLRIHPGTPGRLPTTTNGLVL